MAPREGFFETNPAPTIGSNLTGTLNALVAGVKAVAGTGTLFTTELAVDNIITFVDTAGERQFYTVDAIADNTNLTLSQDTRSISAIATTYGIATMNTNFIVVRDEKNLTYPLADPVLGRIGGGLTSGFRLNAPSLTGISFIDSISPNEGVRLNSIYIRLPYQHTGADKSYMVSLFQVNDGTSANTLITEFGVNGTAFIPLENGGIPINIYIPPLTVRWGLAALISNAKTNQNESISIAVDNIESRLSNVSVPSEMTGLILPIVIGVRFTYGLTITGG